MLGRYSLELSSEGLNVDDTLSAVIEQTAPFRNLNGLIGSWQVGTTAPTYAVAIGLGPWMLLREEYLAGMLVLALGGLLFVRLFVLMHDCGHRTLFATPLINDTVGALLGGLILTPFRYWRRSHALHHAHAACSDQQTHGYPPIWTVSKYVASGTLMKIAYRTYRFPPLFFCVVPALYILVVQRLPWYMPKEWSCERQSAYLTNIVGVAWITLVGLVFGWMEVILGVAVVASIGACLGSVLVFLQHHFEDAKWQLQADWRYDKAAMQSSSYIRLPWILEWFTANVGLHHLHHADCRVPNFRLKRCHRSVSVLASCRSFTLQQAVRAMRLHLIAADGSLVSFSSIAKPSSAGSHPMKR